MTYLARSLKFALPPRFPDDEKTRIAGVLNTSALSTLAGLSTLALYRGLSGHPRLVSPLALMCVVAIATLFLLRRGRVAFCSGLLPGTLLGFLMTMIVRNDGIHDTAVIALPAVLVLAGLVQGSKGFILFTAATLSSVALAGSLDIAGILHSNFPGRTNLTDVLDIVVILGVTALTIRLLSSHLRRSLSRAKDNEKRIEEQARLLDVSRDAIIVRDMDDILVFFNRASEELYGWSFAEAQAISPDELITPGDLEKYRRAKEEVMEKGEWDGELRQRARGGKELIVQTHWTLVRDTSGKPTSRLIVNRDITEKRLLEAQLRRSQRLESLGVLAGGIAHDLNNVLAPITMSLALLDRRVTDPGVKKYIASLEASAQRGSDIVRQVLLFARGSEKEFVPQQLRYAIKEISLIIHETFPRTLRLVTDVAHDLGYVLGDATQLHQVLLNLCVNARDAMEEGGELTITASNMHLTAADAKLLLGGKPGDYVLLSVADTGTGIPKEIQERIFEPFFTTKEPGKGTGLGLSTVYAIVKDHNGFVTLTSEPGRGTTFHIHIPAIRHEEVPVQPVRKLTPAPGNGESILVVDDELAILEIARALLELNGYRVITASNGLDAVSTFRSFPRGVIRLILTDVNLPGIDGIAAVEQIRRVDTDVRVIVASGLATDLNPVTKRELNIQGYLMKPYTSERMLSMVQGSLGGGDPRGDGGVE